MDLINIILSNCSGLRLVLLSFITSPAPENCLPTPAEVAAMEKVRRARRDKRGHFSC
jgi:hypothetical protein